QLLDDIALFERQAEPSEQLCSVDRMEQTGAANILVATPFLQVVINANQVCQESLVSAVWHRICAETNQEIHHATIIGIHNKLLQILVSSAIVSCAASDGNEKRRTWHGGRYLWLRRDFERR